jgi:hypothetical protein
MTISPLVQAKGDAEAARAMARQYGYADIVAMLEKAESAARTPNTNSAGRSSTG